MFRVILVISTSATVMLVIAAVFFCDEGEVGRIDRDAMSLFRQGKLEEASTLWSEGLRKFPDSPRLHYRLGTALATRDDLKAGLPHLERAFQLDPQNLDIQKELSICYLRLDRLDDAERELTRLIERNDSYPEAHFFLGMIYEKRGENERAMEEYVREVNANACCTYAWAKIMTLDERRSQPEE